MTSSMMTGEQRWASKRRSGMTVLGKVAKVAAPKPLNLPSQRLENHGLDPHVEIVPKGTLSWGSRPSSSSSNAWATSALSPSTDGGSSSPSHLAGRPLSGGGTRPSTAGSDKAPDSNSWGPNSRPSSASGVLGSNHTSLTSLRPHSAETRPGSSQLSRFAEHSPEASGAWGPSASSERMGVNEGFSLSSGDFPTLGSEKDESRRNLESLDASHGRPGSSSGEGNMPESMEIAHDDARDSEIKGHSWRKDGLPSVEGGPRPSIERWHGDPHLYQNQNIGPPHYDSWRGPPSVNPQGGGWYRGPPAPPPYGGPIPPGGFHMEPFPYYPPQVPAPGLAKSQSIPPGAGHHGHHPINGDMYRPHMPESFIRPGVPMRPGFYPGPVHFEGYHHRPPMGFCNPNERDLQFMGMAGGPIYNRPTNHYAHDLNNSHPRSHEGRGPDQVDPDHLHDPRGNYKVLVKRNDGWNQNDEEKWSHRVTTEGSDSEKGILSRATLQENAWGNDYKDHEGIGYGQCAAKDDVPSRYRDVRFHSNNPANSKSSGSVSNVEEHGTLPARDFLASSRDHSMMQKIEGLNAKAHASGGNQDAFHKEELTERVQVIHDKADTGVVFERHYPTGVLVPVSRDTNVIASERSGESIITAGPRRAMHGAPNRGNHHGKGNLDGHEASRWGRKSQSHSVWSAGSNIATNEQVEDHNSAVHEATTIELKADGESALSGLDPNDIQRVKMREIAKQRAVQLQKEEEERIREQKAKALAKLEELNRRSSATQVAEASSQKEVVTPYSAGTLKPEPNLEANSIGGPSSGSSNKIAHINEKEASKVVDSVSVAISRHADGESKKNAQQDSVSSQNQLPTANINVEDTAGNKIAAQVRDISKHKRAGYKPRQNAAPEKNIPPKDVLEHYKGENAIQDITVGIKADGEDGKELPETPLVSESSAPQKRRHNKSGKNKHRAEDLSSAVSSTVSLPNKSEVGQAISASAGDNASDLRASSASVQLSADAKDPSQSSGSHSSLSREDDHGRANHSWKTQHSRKTKSSQGNRLSEKTQSNDAVVWAPVRSHSKDEVPDQTSQKAAEPLVSSSGGENMPQNSPKTKRAEMERYVPKPVAKELAQQGSIHQPPSLSVDHSHIAQASVDSSAGSGGREKASEGSDSVAKAVPVVGGKNRHSKGHGSWRQRISAESNSTQAFQGASVGITSKNIQPSSEQTVRYKESMMTETPNRPHETTMKGLEAHLSDGWSSVNDSNSNSTATYTGVKDQFPSGRGKRQTFKGQKGNNQSSEHQNSNAGLPDSQYSSEIYHTEKTQFSKENRPALDRSGSHWQPKSQVNVVHDQTGKWSRGGQSHVADDNMGLKLDIGSGSGVQTQSHNSHYSQSEDKAVRDMSHHEPNREKMDHHVKRRPQPPSRGLETEAAPVSSKAVDGNNEQRPSSGYRKNSNYGGRGDRVHEFRGDWSTTAPESKHHYSSANQERQRLNSQYEYQAVGSYNETEPQTDNQRGGTHFRGRGHPRRGRGNFYGRQSSYE